MALVDMVTIKGYVKCENYGRNIDATYLTLLHDAFAISVGRCILPHLLRNERVCSRCIEIQEVTPIEHFAQHRSLVEHGCVLSVANHGGAERVFTDWPGSHIRGVHELRHTGTCGEAFSGLSP